MSGRAYDGTTGLALADAYQPDVLLLDISMPGMTGLEVARQVRQKARLNDCFIIAVTGRTDAAYRLQCDEAEIDLFLIKPVTPSILKTLLIWEFEYVSRARQDITMYSGLSTTFEPLTEPKSYRPAQLPCQVLQAAVAS